MMSDLKIRLSAVTLDCRNMEELAKFYEKLLNWKIHYSGGDYTVIGVPDTRMGFYPSITLQHNPEYLPPVWPEREGEQQQMAHLDFAVNDMEKAVSHALKCGARKADMQFNENWTVMIDPEEHPFCLVAMKEIMESPDFGLL